MKNSTCNNIAPNDGDVLVTVSAALLVVEAKRVHHFVLNFSNLKKHQHLKYRWKVLDAIPLATGPIRLPGKYSQVEDRQVVVRQPELRKSCTC